MTTLTEIETGSRRDHYDDYKTMMIKLYEAAVKGCVETLNSLLEEDRLLLSKISLTRFVETPLHISSLHGHVDFTKQLLNHKPKLASKLDHHKRSPLHLAASEGHVEIARALLHTNKDVCMVEDNDGRIPLHYAAMNGCVDLIHLLLISAGVESVCQKLPSGETALHLCVQHNHLEALKLLVESAVLSLNLNNSTEVLNAKVVESGNTILHLAVIQRQVETVEYLLSIAEMEKDILNRKGYKASDLLDDQPNDFNTYQLQCVMNVKQPTSTCHNITNSKNNNKSLLRKQWISMHLRKHRREWLKNVEGSIMVVATLIVATTFQAAVNPPGGVWQQTYNTTKAIEDSTDCSIETCGHKNGTCTERKICYAGTSIMAQIDDYHYALFVWFNSIAFLASLSIIILIIGGVPINNKFCIWLFDLVLFATLFCVGQSFLYANILVTPDYGDYYESLNTVYNCSIYVWEGMFVLMGAWHVAYLKGTLNRKNERAWDLVNRLPMTENRKKIEKAMGITKSKRFTYRWILERLDDYKGEWLKEMRGSIMVVATVIATMTFQTATNPPGGVWQETSNSHVAFDGYVYFDCDRDHYDDYTTMMIKLYEAAVKGCVETLNSLLEEDKLLLSKISLTRFVETPLHISSLHGHVDFTKQLLNHKPKLASKLDHHKRSPLHLAASEGHVEIARALLHTNKDVCMVEDNDGRIPLHYAAMNGCVDLIHLLLISAGLPSGETALHLCVQHNHLEALKLLVESAVLSLSLNNSTEVLNARVVESGNTILHLAVIQRQVETVEYLVSMKEMDKDILNWKDHKASDLLNDQPQDFNTFRLQRVMMMNMKQQPMSTTCHNNNNNKSLLSKQWISIHLRKQRRQWLKNVEGSIMVVATLIVSTTFQAAVNPPGGVWQQTNNTTQASNDISDCSNQTCIAGTSVMAHIDNDNYAFFVWFNSIAFLGSLSIIILIIGGVPMNNKFWIWLFDLVLFVTLFCVGESFLHANILVTPDHGDYYESLDTVYKCSIYVWEGMFVVMGAWHLAYLVIKLRNWLHKRSCCNINGRIK
ncbi:hypothetical protein G4B88_022407 [Cannabis sativa]|uniref:PGG domain-containing protein n=1 Tax=Cannabis sativa TaxID=3483 RepID=A0A7J6HVI0_CANSA|nr:hypothetical protein G4B88_022407 [Cannabis sativa]